MKPVLIFIMFSLLAFPAKADIDTDRSVGNCAGLLSAMKKTAGAENALGFADNQNRAIKFAMAWMDKVKKANGDKNKTEALVYTASSDCRKIGIRTSD